MKLDLLPDLIHLNDNRRQGIAQVFSCGLNWIQHNAFHLHPHGEMARTSAMPVEAKHQLRVRDSLDLEYLAMRDGRLAGKADRIVMFSQADLVSIAMSTS